MRIKQQYYFLNTRNRKINKATIVKATYPNPALFTPSFWDQQQSAQKKVQTLVQRFRSN